MLALRDLQTRFRQALFEQGPMNVLESVVAGDDEDSRERIAIYRNNVFASLTEALRQTFPVVCRLVGERFFDYSAHEFIAAYPPARPQLSRYGGAFADFLAQFPPCGELRYLPDVARLEWAMNEAATAQDAPARPPDGLENLSSSDPAALLFRLHPALRYLASVWPVDRIWHANQSASNGDGVDLEGGGVFLEVARTNKGAGFRACNAGEYAFRHALASGAPLGAALEAALAVIPDFQADEALTALFREGAVAKIIPAPSEKDSQS